MTYQKIIFTFLSVATLLFTACNSENSKDEVIHVKASNLVKEKLDVKGMTCVGCEARIEKVILKETGVLKFKASSKNHSAVVEFDKSKTSVEKINNTLKEMGYESNTAKK